MGGFRDLREWTRRADTASCSFILREDLSENLCAGIIHSLMQIIEKITCCTFAGIRCKQN